MESNATFGEGLRAGADYMILVDDGRRRPDPCTVCRTKEGRVLNCYSIVKQTATHPDTLAALGAANHSAWKRSRKMNGSSSDHNEAVIAIFGILRSQ